ncbi:hypothetical protein ES703_75944 [subsurface metagenome]
MVEDFEFDLEGWLKLQRSMLAEPWWFGKKPLSKGEIFLIILAQATFEKRRKIEYCGKRIILVRGQAFIIKRALARRAGWHRPQLERFLEYLESHKGERFAITQEIVNKSSDDPVEKPVAIGTIITFINFERLCPK